MAQCAGVDRAILASTWRQRRLPILCFHGISTADEHECFPGCFITPELFRAKLALIRDLGITVLDLDDALRRLASGTLPARSAVITMDDAYYGAYAEGAGILEEFGYPATIYITTHYVRNNRPVFDNMCTYLLWKSAGRQLRWQTISERPILLDGQGQKQAERAIREYAQRQQLSSEAKDHLLHELAERVGIDYDALCARRMFHLVNPDELQTWRGVRFGLHTHRHRVSRDRSVFRDSILRNAAELRFITGDTSQHFAYPGGAYLPEHVSWLRDLGIKSATTCKIGLATAHTDPWLLPRIVDASNLTMLELQSWLTGIAELLPVRSCSLDSSQFESAPMARPAPLPTAHVLTT